MKTFILISLLFSSVAFAEKSNWVLDKKTDGPVSWKCGATGELIIDKNKIEFIATGGDSSVVLDNVNQGIFCDRRQTGSPFGTLRCFETTIEGTQSNYLVQQFTCSTNLPFVQSCNTRVEDADVELSITSSSTLSVLKKTGWSEAPDFECVFKKAF